MFGAVELSIAAALDDAGSRDLAGTFLAIWSAGSLVGGLIAVRWPGRDLERRQHVALLAAALAALLLVPAAGTPAVLAVVLFVHGFTQAPLMAAGYAIVPRVVEGRLSEAFAWLTSAVVGRHRRRHDRRRRGLGAPRSGCRLPDRGRGAARRPGAGARVPALRALMLRSRT